MAPVTDNACRIPTDADALCNTAVMRIPTRIPTKGLLKDVSILMKCSFSRRGATAPLMVCIPIISMVKPSKISPTFRWVDFFASMRNKIPMIATTAAMVAVESNCAIPLDPSI